MLRYSLILLLVNVYGRSLGGPVPEQNSNGKTSIANLLSDLTKQCKNKFVLGLIESKSSSCDVELNYRVVDLQCLMFYDANRLLCNSSANLETEFTAKISEKQNVSAFCNEVSHLTVPSAPYQKMITTVFQSEDSCKKVCTDDDIRTGDTNFFCKYYMWTLLKLQLPQSSQQQHVLTSTANSAGLSSVTVQKTDATGIQALHSRDGEEKNTSGINATSKPQTGKAEETNQHSLEAFKQESSSTAQLTDAQNPESILPSSVDTPIKKITQKPASGSLKNALNTDKTADDKRQEQTSNVDPSDIGNEAGLENNGRNKDPDVSIQQIETPGHKAGLENVNGDDSGNENDDIDEDGRDISDDEDLNGGDLQGKFDPEVRNPNPKPENQGSQNAEASQRDFFQTTDGFTEDDDHFFPFFLTAVIVVVVLYVLYHNKNKVGKMFFGLIVEGRQPGRRRTSRGHAYRRLDTLEQAMSTNTTAPPSKIIY